MLRTEKYLLCFKIWGPASLPVHLMPCSALPGGLAMANSPLGKQGYCVQQN